MYVCMIVHCGFLVFTRKSSGAKAAGCDLPELPLRMPRRRALTARVSTVEKGLQEPGRFVAGLLPLVVFNNPLRCFGFLGIGCWVSI